MAEEDDVPPQVTDTMSGEVYEFLTGNKFRVQLSDGQVIDAVMTDKCLKQIRPWYAKGPPVGVSRIRVTVKFRPAPALPQIIEVGPDSWCGEARAFRG